MADPNGSEPQEFVAGYRTLSTQEIWRGAIFGLREDRVALPGIDRPVIRQYLDHGGAVGIVAARHSPETREIEILLISQYRHPARTILWEIPAGLLDVPGEEPLAAAKRELREEADLRATTWTELVEQYTSPGASSEFLKIYLATDLMDCEQPFARSEEEALMEKRWVPLEKLVELVLGGKIHSPSAVAGTLAAHALRSKGQWPKSAGNRD